MPDAPPLLARTLPARYYVDPVHFRVELDLFFLNRWVHAGRVDDLPGPGDFVLREVAGEGVLLVRSDASRVAAFYNVCPHRGTLLCTEPAGRTGGTIRCPYHAWTFDLAGRLIGAPHMADVPGFHREDWPLATVAVDEWDGHLFLHLGDDPPPLADQLGGVVERFAPWGMGELRRGTRIVYDVAANWKLIIQNYSECLHCPTVHPALSRLSHYLSGENEPATAGALGGAMTLRDGVATMTLDGTTCRLCLPGLGADDRRKVHFYAVMPNLLLSLHPDCVMTHTLWPRAVGRTEIVCDWHFHPDALAAPDFDPSDLTVFWDLTNRQDWHVCELAQRGIASRGYRPGPYSLREGLLHDFDRLVLRELGEEPPAR